MTFAAGCLLLGLKKHSPEICDVILYHDGISPDDQRILKDLFPEIIFQSYGDDAAARWCATAGIDATTYCANYHSVSWALFDVLKQCEKFSKILWLDADMLLQGNISPLFEGNDIAFSLPPVVKTEKGITIQPSISVVGGRKLFNAGAVSLSDCVDFENLYKICCQVAVHFAAQKQVLPPASLLALALQQMGISWRLFSREHVAQSTDIGACDSALCIHALATDGKFWTDPCIYHSYGTWGEYYALWRQMGGTAAPDRVATPRPVSGFARKDLLSHLLMSRFWLSFYERIKNRLPVELLPVMNAGERELVFHVRGLPDVVTYRFRYGDGGRLGISLRIADKVLSDAFSRESLPSISDKFFFIFRTEEDVSTIEAETDVSLALDAFLLLMTKTYPMLRKLFAAMSRNPNQMFDYIYRHNVWTFGSGAGSLANVTAGYRDFLAGFIREKGIRSVVDVGCGDWQFSRLLDWSGVQYTGYDVSSICIENNIRKYAADNIRFVLYDGDFSAIESADLVICKDVLQHLPIEYIHKFIAVLHKFSFALITNDICESAKENSDIPLGGYRCLDLRLPPFHLDCQEVFRIRVKDDVKAVLLWKNHH